MYHRDRPLDERSGLKQLTFNKSSVSDIYNKYSTGLTDTQKTEIDILVGSKQNIIDAIGEGASLVLVGLRCQN